MIPWAPLRPRSGGATRSRSRGHISADAEFGFPARFSRNVNYGLRLLCRYSYPLGWDRGGRKPINPDKDLNNPNISQEARRIANAIGAFGDLGTADRLNLLAELMQMATTLADYELFAVCGALLAATRVRAEWWDAARSSWL